MLIEQKIKEINSGRRLQCLIDDCDRTCVIKNNYASWICQKHWQAVPKRIKRAYFIAKRLYGYEEISEDRLFNAWQRCVDAAIENAAFI